MAKNALLALIDVWTGLLGGSGEKKTTSDLPTQRVMENELVLLAPVLLRRFCDTSGFLVEAAEAALDAVILHTPDTTKGNERRETLPPTHPPTHPFTHPPTHHTTKVLLAFLPLTAHKNPAGRSKVANLVLRCVLVWLSASPSSSLGGRERKRKKGKTPSAMLKDLRERVEKAAQQWTKDAHADTRAKGRKILEVLKAIM